MALQITEWLQSLAGYKTPKTIGYYSGAIRVFNKFLLEHDYSLDKQSIRAYMAHRLEAGATRRTVNANVTAIRSYCKWRAEEFNEPNPTKAIKTLKEDPPKQRVLSEDEYAKVLAVARGEERDLIAFIANTGLRVSEFNSLTWESTAVNLKSLTVIGKGNKRRVVPLKNTCREILERYKACPRIPFIRSNKWTVERICRRLAKQAGIPKFGPHALRHRFATECNRRHLDIPTLSKILGHASSVVTQIVYIHVFREDILGATDILDA